jgi:hypothetical protein
LLTVSGNRYQVTNVNGVAVVGRWECGRVASPAVLDLTSGRVWVFDRWASAGLAVEARAIGRFAGARDLMVVPGRSGCDRLEVIQAHGFRVVSAGAAT